MSSPRQQAARYSDASQFRGNHDPARQNDRWKELEVCAHCGNPVLWCNRQHALDPALHLGTNPGPQPVRPAFALRSYGGGR